VRKFLFAFLICCVNLYAETDFHAQFLKYYYDGDYDAAHAILRKTFTDPLDVQVWEERLHLQKSIEPCDYLKTTSEGAYALALLRIGRIEKAKNKFGNDVPSLLGLATLALWQNDYSASQDFIRRGLQTAPAFPEFLFFAGNLADSDEQAVNFFQQYLSDHPSDELNMLSAQQAIDFVHKTHGLSLNVSSLNAKSAELDSFYDGGRVILNASMDGKPIALLVDTGAAGISLEKADWQPKISSDLLMIGVGKTQKTAGQRAVFNAFSAGSFEIRNPVAAVSETLHGRGVNGIIGSIVFSKYAVLLPMLPGKTLSLIAEPAAWLEQNASRYRTRVELPFYSVNKMIIVKGSIKKSEPEMDMLIDSGASRSVLSAAVARKYTHIDYSLSRAENQTNGLSGLGGRVEDMLIAENTELKIGSIGKDFNRIPALNLSEISEALQLELDAILGQDFLDGYTLLIDYRNRTITFLK
jgi:gag-polyprotein putative aspartyl protease